MEASRMRRNNMQNNVPKVFTAASESYKVDVDSLPWLQNIPNYNAENTRFRCGKYPISVIVKHSAVGLHSENKIDIVSAPEIWAENTASHWTDWTVGRRRTSCTWRERCTKRRRHRWTWRAVVVVRQPPTRSEVEERTAKSARCRAPAKMRMRLTSVEPNTRR